MCICDQSPKPSQSPTTLPTPHFAGISSNPPNPPIGRGNPPGMSVGAKVHAARMAPSPKSWEAGKIKFDQTVRRDRRGGARCSGRGASLMPSQNARSDLVRLKPRRLNSVARRLDVTGSRPAWWRTSLTAASNAAACTRSPGAGSTHMSMKSPTRGDPRQPPFPVAGRARVLPSLRHRRKANRNHPARGRDASSRPRRRATRRRAGTTRVQRLPDHARRGVGRFAKRL